MGSIVWVPLGGPSMLAEPRPTTVERPTDTPSVEAWRVAGPLSGSGLMVVHDAWGVDREVRNLADALAATGYTVIAPDLAAGWLPQDAREAELLAASISPEAAARVLAATIDALRAYPSVERQRVGVIGLGMGAPLAAFLATLRADVAAVICAGPVPDLPADTWGRADAAFLVLPPAEADDAVADASAWADTLRTLGLDVTVAPAAVPAADGEQPADPAALVEWALPGARDFLARHLG